MPGTHQVIHGLNARRVFIGEDSLAAVGGPVDNNGGHRPCRTRDLNTTGGHLAEKEAVDTARNHGFHSVLHLGRAVFTFRHHHHVVALATDIEQTPNHGGGEACNSDFVRDEADGVTAPSSQTASVDIRRVTKRLSRRPHARGSRFRDARTRPVVQYHTDRCSREPCFAGDIGQRHSLRHSCPFIVEPSV